MLLKFIVLSWVLLSGSVEPAWAKCVSVFGHSSTVYESSVDGIYGGKMRVLKRVGKRWYTGNDVYRGDPNWFVQLLGKEAAEFFRVIQINDSTFLLGDAKETNGAIKKFNSWVAERPEEQIPLSFYESEGTVNPEVFTARFAYGAEIPLARSTEDAYHDMNWHKAVLAQPKRLVDAKRARARAAIEFRSFILGKAPHLFTEPEMLLKLKGIITDEGAGADKFGAISIAFLKEFPVGAFASYLGKDPFEYFIYNSLQGRVEDKNGWTSTAIALRRVVNNWFSFRPGYSEIQAHCEEFLRDLERREDLHPMRLTLTEMKQMAMDRVEFIKRTVRQRRSH